ncbi:MAG TPA: tetratricopeptide repeat protein, partial [Polyangia bacterium]
MAKDQSKLRRKAAEQQKRGNKDKALALLKEACEKDPYDPENWTALADLQIADGQSGPAAESLFKACDIFARSGLVRDALAACRRTLEVDAGHGPARRMSRFLVSRLPDEEQEAAEASFEKPAAARPARAAAPAAPEPEPAPKPAPAAVAAPAPEAPPPAPAAPVVSAAAPVEAAPAPPEPSEAALEEALKAIPDLGRQAGEEAPLDAGVPEHVAVDTSAPAAGPAHEAAPETTDVEPTIPRWQPDDEQTRPWMRSEQPLHGDLGEGTLAAWPPVLPEKPASGEEETTMPAWRPRAGAAAPDPAPVPVPSPDPAPYALPPPPVEILTLEMEAELPEEEAAAAPAPAAAETTAREEAPAGTQPAAAASGEAAPA